jgi:hypothetical protein
VLVPIARPTRKLSSGNGFLNKCRRYILSLENSDLVYVHDMESHDENKEALRQVEKATESEPVKGEDLLESKDLKRNLADSKKRITADNTARPERSD